MDNSAPNENRLIPKIKNRVPTRKLNIKSVGRGEMVSDSNSTIATIGSTLFADSIICSRISPYMNMRRFFAINTPLSCGYIRIIHYDCFQQ